MTPPAGELRDPRLPEWIDHFTDRYATCREESCRRRFRWAVKTDGRLVPVDVAPDPQSGKFLPHHATCPGAKRFRSKRSRKRPAAGSHEVEIPERES